MLHCLYMMALISSGDLLSSMQELGCFLYSLYLLHPNFSRISQSYSHSSWLSWFECELNAFAVRWLVTTAREREKVTVRKGKHRI